MTDTDSFLDALARRIDIRLVVLVPADAPARVLWRREGTGNHDSGPGADELTSAGRAALRGEPAPVAVEVAVRLVGALDAQPATDAGRPAPTGALVAAKDPGADWTATEHTLLEAVASFYRLQLQRSGSRRPLPRPPALTDGRDAASADGPGPAQRVRVAVERDELFLRYQPVVDLADERIVAVEALARWRHPRRGELSPDAFIAVAERSSLIRDVGAWALDTACRDLARWRARIAGLAVTTRVNVSPPELLDPHFVDMVTATLHRHGLPPAAVGLELTEGLSIEDDPLVSAQVLRLHDLGVHVALDDLASGYSSLGRLRILPVAAVKIDRSLVAGIDGDARARSIVAALAALGVELGLEVVVEGVETAAEAEAVRSLGCRRAQGHWFGRPTVAADTEALLADRGVRLV